MSQTLVPAVSSTIEYETGPALDPPPTTFPYPDGTESVAQNSQDESDSTLYDGPNDHIPSLPNDLDSRAALDEASQRPSLAVRKFETDVVHPVAQRLPPPVREHLSATSQRRAQYLEDASLSSESEGWGSSEDEYTQALRKSQTHPDGNLLSKSQLNRVRTHPKFSNLKVGNEFFQSRGRVSKDGRVKISINETANTGYLAKALGATIEHHLSRQNLREIKAAEQGKAESDPLKSGLQIPPMNIVIMVIGSRGDIQPFLKIGKILKDRYHHRVRIATHPTFRKFVEEDIGLEFFSVGGDPSELMAFMVKNPGLIPSLETVKTGEIGRRRESMYQMFQGFWRACINATDDETDTSNLKMMGTKAPFVADAIIANPPSFAHYHCAERLSIPLHLVFTFPYSPTQAFPHPLANIKSTNVDQSYVNFMSYPLVDLMTWQGLGDLVNRFRVETLGLEPVSTLWAPGQLCRLRVPMTYLWSPGLVPKPADWGPEIDIAGYVFLDLASSYAPPQDLAAFLQRSDDRPIIYIGFGSISGIDDPAALTRMIFEAVSTARVRAVISRGWGGMGDGMEKPDGVFMVDNVPHDWLFPQVDAVVHHGGAGTTAAGLRFGKPTMIVPFFGDQPFWSAMIAKAGAGAKESLPLKKLDSDKFAAGIRQCLEPDAKAKAEEIARSIQQEGDGAENAVDSFHRSLPLKGPHSMRCDIFTDRVAVWKVRHATTQLSALAADLLVGNKELLWADLDLKRNREWSDFQGPGEPITGAGGVLVQAFQEAFHGLALMHEDAKRDIKRYEKRRRMRREKSTVDALVLPGRIAYATRGTSVEQQRKEYARMGRELNLRGSAEPARSPFTPSPSPEDPETTLHLTTTTSSDSHSPAVVVILKHVGKGIGHSSRVIATLPLQMWNAVALGFHNAPRLYGDKTVRPAPQKISGFRSGVRAASTEFCLGFYDGVTGVVRLPYLEVHEDGVAGLPMGMAKGIGGLVLKPISGIVGLGAYTWKGIHQNMRRRVRDTQKTERWIRRARITQGQLDVHALEASTRMSPELAHSLPSHEFDALRDHALRHWTTYEKDKVSEAQAKENRKRLFLPSKGTAKGIPRAQTQ